MRKVFEPDEMELADLGGDTHFVADIQRHVKQMLGERGKRREEIRQEIKALGPRALPGVLNAAFVFTVQLKERDQELLAGLLAELVGDNLAAREMLLRAGVLEAPFVPTRKTAVTALQQLGDIREEEMAQIRLKAWRDADVSGDYEAALALYELLAQYGDDQVCSEISHLTKDLFREHMDIGPRFLNAALRCAPQESYRILKDALGAMDREATEFSRAIYNMSNEFVSPHLLQILQAANEVKENAEGHAHKGIQNLFTGPIASYLRDHPETVVDTGELIDREYKSLYRFWWQGLGRLLDLEVVRQYSEDQTTLPLDAFALEGAVQLLFTEKDNAKFKLWALDILERLEESAPDQYQNALHEFAQRQGKAVDDPGINPSRRSTLTKV